MTPSVASDDLLRRREAVTRLGASMRSALVAAAVTEVSVRELDEAARRADELAALLAARVRPAGEVSPVDDLDADIRYQNPVSGEGNGMAPPLRFDRDGEITLARTSLDARFEGPPGFVHGGFTAAMFDEVVGRALEVQGRVGMTASLSVTYHRPVPADQVIELRAWIVRVDGRKTWSRGVLTTVDDPDTVLAEADGLFIEPRQEKLAEYFGALVDAEGAPVAATAWGQLARD